MAESKKPKKAPTCPKCGQEMDDRGDKFWVCGDCGWEQPKGKQ
jgi:ribosomal protein S27AE